MRKMTADICGEDRDLVATFAASVDLAEKVGDPMLITREAALESVLLAQGVTSYIPKWRFTVQNIPQIIHIGLKAAGESLKLSDVQEWAFDVGFNRSQAIAAEYVALITRPRPDVEIEDVAGEGEPAGE